ncbi:glycoside hydrolase family 16 protein [Zasmidium cellare ATCC 36951]|uniref:Glycoside hydrolase family 16 protein n=1 Tax=Zasmidium cellare ATCC 36951 TaxID=1080233 RepID=A0A6A6CD78_ZASCE|nr:glycoside hydrolase family 16 protein [Zasmidium cellare ATCC 36951]KAF2165045.1 glycoside hydrolase family 16 protein [Zasmidium cellare ATCC 36951]
MRVALSGISMLSTLAAAQQQYPSTEHALCPCGHTVNATGWEDGWALFTEFFESDFLHAHDLKDDDDDTWIPQAYNVTPGDGRGTYGKASLVENVVTNPIESVYDWSGPGVNGEDPGLQLWVRKDLVDVDGGKAVPMAEIVSARDDILYGSFRIGMKTTAVAGTCGAFFFYKNDSNEIDMEFLSSHQQPLSNHGLVNLVIQSPESADVGYVQPGSNDFDNHSMSFAPSEMYHEYRFDWLPDRVDFYADSKWMSTIRTNVPKSPGAIHVSHWSNGNPGWSAGPPVKDAVMTISYIKAYFNSSNPEATAKSLEICQPRELPNSTCYIPNQWYPPDPMGIEGNATGHTHFFTVDIEKTSPDPPPRPPVSTPDVVPSAAAIGRPLSLEVFAVYLVTLVMVVVMGECRHDVPLVVYSLLG